jgi:membrane protein
MRIPIVTTLYRAGLEWNNDNASFLGAALAYYALFSIAPLLIIGMAMVGIFFTPQAVEQHMVSQIQEAIGGESARAVQELIRFSWDPTTSLWATIVGPPVLLIAAANLFRQLRVALDMLWGLPPLAWKNVFHSAVITYLLAVLMVLITACFWLALMAGDSMLSYFIHEFREFLPGGVVRWKLGQYGLLLVVQTLYFALTFRVLSHGRILYAHLWFGCLVGALLFLLGRVAFGFYISYMGKGLATAFGAASSLVIFLIWVYYSAQIIFYAAEVVKVKIRDAQAQHASSVKPS